jgi:hypothetical protein
MRLFLLGFLFLAAGCRSTYVLEPEQLVALDGFDVSKPEARVRTLPQVRFAAGDELGLAFPDGTWAGGEFQRIEARADRFTGTLADGRQVTVDPRRLHSAMVVGVSVGRTVLALAMLCAAMGFIGVVACPLRSDC